MLSFTLVVTAYAMGMAGISGVTKRLNHLIAARRATYATCVLILASSALLAFAFQVHDFRISYVARYSDRSMPWWYILSSLWGGQDGSLLWWSLLLSGYTAVCTHRLRGRHFELQPWVLATLMSIVGFFLLLMLFAANPFAPTPSGTAADGEGLNPLLQNYWMMIHPPSLYMGFVGWSVPFAFAMAALISGKLDESWLKASHGWTLFAWMWLSIGLLLGMFWSYEELGWGGYWAWDPVENASFHPWLVGTALLHSVMVQERYRMLRVWNLTLAGLAFWMMIFGTFLTRSGLIASVHAFAKSDIGVYFVGYLITLALVFIALMAWRWPQLRPKQRILSLLSRESAILTNNWLFLALMLLVVFATTFPLLSDWLQGEEITVGPEFYNQWTIPVGLLILLLMGIGPLMAWRKATGKRLLRALLVPSVVAALVATAQAIGGAHWGYPMQVSIDALYPNTMGALLAFMAGISPWITVFCTAFVIAAVLQELWRGARARMRSHREPLWLALGRLVQRSRRRYGGYVVHTGMALMYFGFAGSAYDYEREVLLAPNERTHIGNYTLHYHGARMEMDPNKRMAFADATLLNRDETASLAEVAPAKFIYRTHPQMPTTEVAIHSTLKEDVYVIMSRIDPATQNATFRILVRPWVMWIWLGGIVLILGTVMALFPSARRVLESQPLRAPLSPHQLARLWAKPSDGAIAS